MILQSMNENRDFLQSNFIEISFFVTCASPLWVSIFLHILQGNPYQELLVTLDLLTDDQKLMVRAVYVLVSIKAFACFLLIFNPFDRLSYREKYPWTAKATDITIYGSMIL